MWRLAVRVGVGAALCRHAAGATLGGGARANAACEPGGGVGGGKPKRRPVVVCGPSGVGKGTLLGRLMKEHPEEFGFSVSHTTRQPRPGEQDGVHYHFVSREEMEAMSTRAYIAAANAARPHMCNAYILL